VKAREQPLDKLNSTDTQHFSAIAIVISGPKITGLDIH
jgi:hypothetical protein